MANTTDGAAVMANTTVGRLLLHIAAAAIVAGLLVGTIALAQPVNPNEAILRLQQDMRDVKQELKALHDEFEKEKGEVRASQSAQSERIAEQRLDVITRTAVLERQAAVNAGRLDRIEQFGVGLMAMMAGNILVTLVMGRKK